MPFQKKLKANLSLAIIKGGCKTTSCRKTYV